MTFRLIIVAGTIGVLLGATAARPATAEGGSVAETCPAYRTHLRNARDSLTRGDRSVTLTELKRAQEALESCLRDEASEVALASRSLWTPIG